MNPKRVPEADGVISPAIQRNPFAVVDGIKTVRQLAEKVKALRPELDIAHSQVIDANGEPMEVDYALAWLKLRKPEEAVQYETAVSEGRKLRDKPGNPTGRNQHSPKEETLQSKDSNREYGNRRDYLMARLERDAPDILEDYQQGNYKSVRAAAIAAGIIKVPTAFEMAVKLVAKLTDDEWKEVQTLRNRSL